MHQRRRSIRTNNPRVCRAATGIALAACLLVLTPIAASATPPKPDIEVAETVAAALQQVVGEEAATTAIAEVRGEKMSHSGEGFAVEVPLEANEIRVEMESQEAGEGDTFLPLTLTTGNGETDRVYQNGFLAAPAANSSQTVVQPTVTGVRVLHVIYNSAAPKEFSTEVASDERIDPVFYDETGQVFLHDINGRFLGEIEPAWAVDAVGQVVPTYYTWEDGVLTQIVEHSTGGFVYPIVADPTWTYSFTLSDPDYSQGITVDKAMTELRRCFNCSFPVTGAPKAFPKINQILPLNASPFSFKSIPNVNARVKITATAWRTWRFTAEPGHFDGSGSTITFAWYQTCSWNKKPRIHLNVGAVIKVDRGAAANAVNKAVAHTQWGLFVSRTYYNAIKYQGAVNTC